MSNLAKAAWALLIVVVVGNNITHLLSSNLALLGWLIIAVLLGLDYYNKKASPAARAAKAQGNAAKSASLEVPLGVGEGVVYVYREGGLFAAGLAQAAPDGLTPVALKPMSFARWVLPAGEHRLRAEMKGTNAFAENLADENVFAVAAGERVFFRLSVKMDLKKFTVSTDREMDTAAGLRKLQQLSLAG